MTAGKLFSSFKLGALTLPNRIAMAPMTRWMSSSLSPCCSNRPMRKRISLS